MATLTINGQKVQVDDSFLSLPPDQQEATVEEIAKSLGPKVDPATGQPPGVPAFDPGVKGYDPKTGWVEKQFGPIGSGLMGAGDSATFGFGDEITATALAGTNGLTRSQILARMRGDQAAAQAQNPGSYLGGQIGGGVVQAVAGGGAGFGANAIRSGGGLGRVALGTAADGALYGAVQGAGGGKDAMSRGIGALKGGVAGGVVGGAAPYAVAGVQAAARPLIAPIMSRIRPQSYAERAMAEGMRRAGMSQDEIADALARSRADGQDMFNVADAMGHSGQRMLSTVARNPNDMRQPTIDALTRRQMGQGERLSNTLAEGFGAPDTAIQRGVALKAARTSSANANYAAARQGAGPVNLNNTIGTIDRLMKRNPILGESALTKTEIGSRLARLRSQMNNKGQQLIDFDTVLNVKEDIFAAMQSLKKSGKSVPHELSEVYGELDKALEGASAGYRAANDTFRQQSKNMEAVDLGTSAASGRTRAPDNIQTFNGLTPEGQAGFRSGYADPLIARVESSAAAPTTNKARPLITDKTGQEFPAFAVPGQGDRMGRRIAREQRMFETANTAMGGSKTADNLADAAEMGKFDPGVIMTLLQGRPVQAAVQSVGRLIKESQGMSPGVIERIARMLLETRPDVARAMLANVGTRQAVADGRRALANAIIRNWGGVAGANLSSP